MSATISGFFGEYRWLSNYHLIDLDFYGRIWPSTEHLYQAMKTLVHDEQEMIRTQPSPKDAKRASKKLTIRPDWDTTRLAAMMAVTYLKFSNENLRAKLVETGDAILVEENTWGDVFWGVCNGVGENWLGRVIMDERARIKSGLFYDGPLDLVLGA